MPNKIKPYTINFSGNVQRKGMFHSFNDKPSIFLIIMLKSKFLVKILDLSLNFFGYFYLNRSEPDVLGSLHKHTNKNIFR